MKKITALTFILLALILAACGGSEAELTETPPTEAPPTEAPPTEAPPTEIPATEGTGSPLDSMEHVPDPNLVNINWQWERREQDGAVAFEVPVPGDYLLFFNEDGMFSAKMDCNFSNGQYATPTPGHIFMELGPVTLAECGPESHSTDMMNMFGPAQDYRFEEDGAVVAFVWAAGGPVDYYRNLATVPTEPLEGSYLDSLDHTVDPNLVNKTWAWESRDPNGNDIPAINVPNPENYTLVFNEDGTFNAKLDCNNANGRYATTMVGNPQSSIFMELGPTQLVFCGEGSLDQDMVNMFGPAQSYEFLENGNVLKFIWVAGGPIDYYRNVSDVDLPEPEAGVPSGTVTAPDGVFLRVGPGTDYPYVGAAPFGETGEIIGKSQDGQWWLAAAPNLPGGQVWVSAQYVDAVNVENVPVVAAPAIEPPLTAVPWEWVSTTDPAGVTTVPNPANYIIHFKDDGTVDIKADCNNVLASYTTDGSNISITPGPSTMVACGLDSLDSQFMAQLSSAIIYFINGGNLYLDLPADSGTMRFVPQGTPPPTAEQPPAGEAEGSTFYLVSYGPENAPQTLIPGSQITAHFANDQVTGNAGCNNYSATISTAEGGFAVGPIVTTRKSCSEPAGVMEQEQAYLTALESAGAYQWEQSLVNEATLITQGKIFYTQPDGTTGVLNFVSSP